MEAQLNEKKNPVCFVEILKTQEDLNQIIILSQLGQSCD